MNPLPTESLPRDFVASRAPRRLTAGLAAVCVSVVGASAQATVSGSLSDSTTGPLQSGMVYEVVGNIDVPLGQTLTVEPGAIVKFNYDLKFNVNGALMVDGNAGNPVLFTEIRDDTGGDTNGDGNATSPAANSWRGLVFHSTAGASVVRHARVRFGGRYDSGVELLSCDATFVGVEVTDCARSGWDLTASSRPTLAGCSATGSAGSAFDGVELRALSGFSGLSASGNNSDWINVTSATVVSGEVVAFDGSNGIGGAIHLDVNASVEPGGQLDIGPGAIIKVGYDKIFTSNGQLNIAGTASDPAWFTDERDDAVGGDSNGDGAATGPARNWWRGIQLNAGASASVIDHVRVRYAGRYIAGFELIGCDASLSNAEVSDIEGPGFNLNTSSRPQLSGVHVTRCTEAAFGRVPIQALPGFSGLTAADNARNWIDVTSGFVAPGESITVGPQNGVNGVIRMGSTVDVEPGATLTLDAGLIIKMRYDESWAIDGQLFVNGAPGARVQVVDERDDRGGDSNGDGNMTAPGRDWWRGITFGNSSDGSVVRRLEVRHGGRYIGGVVLNNASITLEDCLIGDIAGPGLDMALNPEPCTITRCRVDNCTEEAFDRVRLDRVADFESPRAFGNAGDRMRVTGGTVSGDATIKPLNQVNGHVFIAADIRVPAGSSLSLQSGTVLKMGYDEGITVDGALAVRGTFDQQVIITSENDTTVGSNPGTDPGTPGQWRGLTLRSTTAISPILGLEVRNGGRYVPNIAVLTPNAVLRDVRTQRSSQAGIRLDAHPIMAERIASWANSGHGIELNGGSFDLRQATCVGNTGNGIQANAGWTGDVIDSICWSNALAFNGVGAGRVHYSDGDATLAGTDGNLYVDPLFVDEANGDLHLQASSPCIDAGDPSSPLDPDSTRADQGAYFFNVCAPRVFCAQAPVGPCTPSVSTSGFASLSSPFPFWLRVHDAPTNSFAIFFYGVGSETVISGLYGNVCVGGPYQRTPAVPSGGDPTVGPCDGLFELDFNEFAQSGFDPAIVAGANVIGHFWYRYGAAPGGARFSEAIEMPVCP